MDFSSSFLDISSLHHPINIFIPLFHKRKPLKTISSYEEQLTWEIPAI